jgi:hypothetical protein
VVAVNRGPSEPCWKFLQHEALLMGHYFLGLVATADEIKATDRHDIEGIAIGD